PPVVGEPRAEGLPLALVRRRMGALRRTARDREGARPRERLRGSRPAARRPAARLPAPGLYRPPHERHDARDRNAAVPTGGPFRATPRRARGDPRYVQPRVLLLHAGKARDPQRPFPLPEIRVRGRPTLVPRHAARTRLPPHRSARLAPREPPSCVGRLRRRSARDGDANRRSAPEPLCCRSPFGPVEDDDSRDLRGRGGLRPEEVRAMVRRYPRLSNLRRRPRTLDDRRGPVGEVSDSLVRDGRPEEQETAQVAGRQHRDPVRDERTVPAHLRPLEAPTRSVLDASEEAAVGMGREVPRPRRQRILVDARVVNGDFRLARLVPHGAVDAERRTWSRRLPAGVPHPVHGSQPGLAEKPSLLPLVTSWNVAAPTDE